MRAIIKIGEWMTFRNIPYSAKKVGYVDIPILPAQELAEPGKSPMGTEIKVWQLSCRLTHHLTETDGYRVPVFTCIEPIPASWRPWEIR